MAKSRRVKRQEEADRTARNLEGFPTQLERWAAGKETSPAVPPVLAGESPAALALRRMGRRSEISVTSGSFEIPEAGALKYSVLKEFLQLYQSEFVSPERLPPDVIYDETGRLDFDRISGVWERVRGTRRQVNFNPRIRDVVFVLDVPSGKEASVPVPEEADRSPMLPSGEESLTGCEPMLSGVQMREIHGHVLLEGDRTGQPVNIGLDGKAHPVYANDTVVFEQAAASGGRIRVHLNETGMAAYRAWMADAARKHPNW